MPQNTTRDLMHRERTRARKCYDAVLRSPGQDPDPHGPLISRFDEWADDFEMAQKICNPDPRLSNNNQPN